MHILSTLAASLALSPLISASNTPLIHNNPFGVTFSATIPQHDATSISGAFKIAAAPDGEGVNIQISLYNLPGSGKISYGIHDASIASGGDCSTAGGLLNPYNGVMGSLCKKSGAACQVGDLSDRHGPATISGGGSGTGYFAASYIDKYLSLRADSPAYVGGKSVVVMSDTGAYLACANLVNAMEASALTTHLNGAATPSTASSEHGGTTVSTGKPYPGPGHERESMRNSALISTSSGLAAPTGASMVGAGLLGIAALLV